ncbi:FMN-dependent oxidoreductase, nitrilotriacetate monooxygenase family [Peribacillus simplex]|uniref:FMN-dependent oxidoreductase, nitrilotriacetate monooxygenase family n=1 Tax=Peribacillus simplex TaxID=1478 RepID=A0A9X8RDZ6_9BACI|nr:LLM class flavin-dependent oxidoreductase [Peribacillus simplex]SIS03866.1 FMN-dependent oxidoreductase, nitrilotriacetate monooxygenase family [Peribacillus simplex]
MRNNKIHIGAFLSGTGWNVASWKHSEAITDASVNLPYLKSLTKKAEEGKMDFVFFGDGLYISEKSHPNFLVRFEPLTLIAALAMETENIGLAATLSASFSEPYNAARQFASIDRLSNGRAGWNVVTSALDGTQRNYGGKQLLEHDLRYKIADEFVEVVKGLWDSWEDDAFIRNKESGNFFDKEKLHRLNYEGEFFSVQGPLNIDRSNQGHPVVFQAGGSKTGREFAARHADAVFTWRSTFEEAQEVYANIKKLAEGYGRSPDEILILPEIGPIIGNTAEEAEAKYQEIANLVDVKDALNFMSRYFSDIDLTKYPLDGEFPDIWGYAKNGWDTHITQIKLMVMERKLSLRQVAIELNTPRHEFIGTPEHVANQLQKWFEGGAADGFMFLVPVLPTGLNDFVDGVVPILQERGLYRTEYEDTTLRGNLGLRVPENRNSLVHFKSTNEVKG